MGTAARSAYTRQKTAREPQVFQLSDTVEPHATRSVWDSLNRSFLKCDGYTLHGMATHDTQNGIALRNASDSILGKVCA